MINEHVAAERKRTVELLKALVDSIGRIFGAH